MFCLVVGVKLVEDLMQRTSFHQNIGRVNTIMFRTMERPPYEQILEDLYLLGNIILGCLIVIIVCIINVVTSTLLFQLLQLVRKSTCFATMGERSARKTREGENKLVQQLSLETTYDCVTLCRIPSSHLLPTSPPHRFEVCFST